MILFFVIRHEIENDGVFGPFYYRDRAEQFAKDKWSEGSKHNSSADYEVREVLTEGSVIL